MRRRLLVNNNLPIKPIEESLAADICLVDNNTLDKLIIEADDYILETFPLEQYTPIGVVVVPASHTDDGTARIMSLVEMDCNNPDNGTVNGNEPMYWGGYGSDISTLDNKAVYPCISSDLREITAETQTIVEWSDITYDSCFLPSDYFDTYPNPYDEGTYYYIGTLSRTYHAGPSPYLTDGAKNEIYHSTANNSNVLADMDGRGNTEKILEFDNHYSTSWQTASTIYHVETGTSLSHPAAQCCWRYHTIGTNQGDWYLPSAGEIGYLVVRWKAINNSILKIIKILGPIAILLHIGGYFWSSTEYDNNNTISLLFTNAFCFFEKNKNTLAYVRSFIAI